LFEVPMEGSFLLLMGMIGVFMLWPLLAFSGGGGGGGAGEVSADFGLRRLGRDARAGCKSTLPDRWS
jgi:hypothetical protein